jgi:hypothetical protein
MSKQQLPTVYSNESKELSYYISGKDFNKFYQNLRDDGFMESIKEKYIPQDKVTDEMVSKVEFCIASPEITPLIPGYTVVIIPEAIADSWGFQGNRENNDIGLSGYIPEDNI